MKRIVPKFQSTTLGFRETYLKFIKFCAGGQHEITHGFAKILFPLWGKSRYLDLEICRIDFPKNFCVGSTRLSHLICGVLKNLIHKF